MISNICLWRLPWCGVVLILFQQLWGWGHSDGWFVHFYLQILPIGFVVVLQRHWWRCEELDGKNRYLSERNTVSVRVLVHITHVLYTDCHDLNLFQLNYQNRYFLVIENTSHYGYWITLSFHTCWQTIDFVMWSFWSRCRSLSIYLATIDSSILTSSDYGGNLEKI